MFCGASIMCLGFTTAFSIYPAREKTGRISYFTFYSVSHDEFTFFTDKPVPIQVW